MGLATIAERRLHSPPPASLIACIFFSGFYTRQINRKEGTNYYAGDSLLYADVAEFGRGRQGDWSETRGSKRV